MQKKNRIILLFPLLFLLITVQAAIFYWNGEEKYPPQETVTINVADSLQ